MEGENLTICSEHSMPLLYKCSCNNYICDKCLIKEHLKHDATMPILKEMIILKEESLRDFEILDSALKKEKDEEIKLLQISIKSQAIINDSMTKILMNCLPEQAKNIRTKRGIFMLDIKNIAVNAKRLINKFLTAIILEKEKISQLMKIIEKGNVTDEFMKLIKTFKKTEVRNLLEFQNNMYYEKAQEEIKQYMDLFYKKLSDIDIMNPNTEEKLKKDNYELLKSIRSMEIEKTNISAEIKIIEKREKEIREKNEKMIEEYRKISKEIKELLMQLLRQMILKKRKMNEK